MALAALICACTLQSQDRLVIEDVFGRDVTSRGITLIQWGGRIANPAVSLRLRLPGQVAFPTNVYLHTESQLIGFDREQREDRYGIGRRVHLETVTDASVFRISALPYSPTAVKAGTAPVREWRTRLWIQAFDPQRKELLRGSIPVRVLNLERPAAGPRYPIVVDYSQDRTGFFHSSEHRRVVEQAAQDWSYFLDDLGEDPVAVGAEISEMWPPDGFTRSHRYANRRPYRGYLLYLAGVDFAEWRSGGAPSPYGKFQTVKGKPTPLRRSGTVNIETAGNYNRLGWFLTQSDSDWFVSGNQRIERNDLYSIAMHEIGHAIGFHPAFTRFGDAKRGSGLYSPELAAYVGNPLRIDASDHFPDLIDPLSGYGGFGREHEGTAKSRRWLITKANLLCLKAIGYRLRHTAAFDDLKLARIPSEFAWSKGLPASGEIKASGGVPDYCFRVVDGELPKGVALDSFTGRLSGTPSSAGIYDCNVEVDDNDPTTPPVRTHLRVAVREKP